MEEVLTPRDELARSLSPLVAIAASQDAEELCQSNHIPSFADFMKPFGDHIEGRGKQYLLIVAVIVRYFSFFSFC